MFGVNLLFIEVKQLELITRKVFSAISYNFDLEVEKGNRPPTGQGGMRLLSIECIEPVFTQQEMMDSQAQLESVTRNGKKVYKHTVLNVYKSSETDFIEKVDAEKQTGHNTPRNYVEET